MYEPVLELPPLPADQYEALRSNIALNGVLVPILVDSGGPVRRIIDGNNRKRISDELGYECPEIVKEGLSDQEKRTLARMLNLARRQLDQAAKRQIIADQLREMPRRSTNWIARQLGVHHATVAAVRAGLVSTLQIVEYERTEGADGKYRPTTYASGARLSKSYAGISGENGYANEPSAPLVEQGQDDEERPGSRLGLDEETILRAAAEIRQRRVAEELRKVQERRRAAQPAPLKRKKGSPVLHGDCNDLIPTLEDGSVALVVTSPPYADQRSGHYQGVPEAVYPQYTVGWMAALWPKLTRGRLRPRRDSSAPAGGGPLGLRTADPAGAPGVRLERVRGVDLVQAQLATLGKQAEAPPGLGERSSGTRRSSQPFADLKACGKPSDRLGFDGSVKFAEGGVSEKSAWHPCVESFGHGAGTARITDAFVVPVGSEEAGVDHPAVYPISLAEQLIRTFSQEDDLVLDPFCGSGQTLLAARACGRRHLGFEREEKYVRLALERLGR